MASRKSKQFRLKNYVLVKVGGSFEELPDEMTGCIKCKTGMTMCCACLAQLIAMLVWTRLYDNAPYVEDALGNGDC